MADATKVVITSEVSSGGVTEKINTTISQINPSITDEQLATFATAIGTLIRIAPDYFTRTNTTILLPDEANENQTRVYQMRKERLKNVEETRTSVLNE